MGVLDNIRRDAADKGVVIDRDRDNLDQNPNSLTHIFDRMFCQAAEPILENAVHGINLDTVGRRKCGLDANMVLAQGKNFCLRESVLALLYKSDDYSVANASKFRMDCADAAALEKWQCLFVRSGYMQPRDLGMQVNYDYGIPIQFAPDFICYVPEYYGWDKQGNDSMMLGTLETFSDTAYRVMAVHPYAEQRLQWYMHLSGKYTHGFVIVENRNTSQFKIETYEYDPDKITKYVDRAKRIAVAYDRVFKCNKMPAKLEWSIPTHSDCRECGMYGACYNVGNGRVRYGRK